MLANKIRIKITSTPNQSSRLKCTIKFYYFEITTHEKPRKISPRVNMLHGLFLTALISNAFLLKKTEIYSLKCRTQARAIQSRTCGSREIAPEKASKSTRAAGIEGAFEQSWKLHFIKRQLVLVGRTNHCSPLGGNCVGNSLEPRHLPED